MRKCFFMPSIFLFTVMLLWIGTFIIHPRIDGSIFTLSYGLTSEAGRLIIGCGFLGEVFEAPTPPNVYARPAYPLEDSYTWSMYLLGNPYPFFRIRAVDNFFNVEIPYWNLVAVIGIIWFLIARKDRTKRSTQ